MKYRSTVLYLVVMLLICATPAFGETEVDITGQVRVRSEASDRTFEEYNQVLEYTDMRSRVTVEALIDSNTHAVIQFQDSRRLGANTAMNTPASGSLNDGKNVDIHQAYIQIDRLWSDGWGAKAGRFELNLGNQRVFGAVGWHNVGRVWEGGSGWYDEESINITGYWLKRMELNYWGYNRDFDIIGTNVTIKRVGVQMFAFYELNAFDVGLVRGSHRLDRLSLGMYYQHVYDQLDVIFNGVYQFGDIMDQTDLAAFLFTLEIGHTLPGKAKARIAAGVDYASGDDDPNDGESNTYNNLYYTGHKFRGYMDYFLSSGTAGLVDLMLRAKGDIASGWLVKTDLHYFKTAAEYIDFTGNKTTDVGIEIDGSVTTNTVAGVDLTAGASLFFPTEAFAGRFDPETGAWFYTMATVNF